MIYKKAEKVYKNKAIGCCAKMIFAFLVLQGGEYEYISKSELNDVLGMSHPLINKGIKELEFYNYITYNKAENKLIIL